MSDKNAKVIKVIDNYRVVINKGESNGVKVGDRYLVFELGEELIDPDTSESLGILEIVKGKGKVIHLQARMATLETYEVERRRKYLTGLELAAGVSPYEDVLKSFEYAKIGDIAVQIGGKST